MLEVNMLIGWVKQKGKIERILWINKGMDLLYVINLLDNGYPYPRSLEELIKSLKSGEAAVLYEDPYIRVIHEDRLTEKQRQYRDRAWEAISNFIELEPDIYDKNIRKRIIKQKSKEIGIHEKTLKNYCVRYWVGGKTVNALTPKFHKCGKNGERRRVGLKKRGRPRENHEVLGKGVNITRDIESIFRKALNKYYYSSAKHSLKVCYELMRAEFFSNGFTVEDGVKVPILKSLDETPTLAQFRYWHSKNRDIKKEVVSRISSKKYDQSYRPILGTSASDVIGPGSMYQIDATVANVYLVSRINRSWIIGRPIIYALIDVFSRMVAGIYIGIEGPSWVSAMMAIFNASRDKVKFCKEYGITINEEDWPVNHVPMSILADRGEIEGKNADNLVKNLGIKVMNTPPYRCDWKGIVEQFFQTSDSSVTSFLPGKVDLTGKERGDKDYTLEAKLDIHQFTKILIRCVMYHNNHHYMQGYNREEMMISDNIEPIPSKLWKWGIENRSGQLRRLPEEFVKLSLTPEGAATVTPKGIKFKGVLYGSRTMYEERWCEKARLKGSWKIQINYDPRDLTFIYIVDNYSSGFEKCYLIEHESKYRGKIVEEIEHLINKEKLMSDENRARVDQGKISLISHIKHVVKEAEELTNDESGVEDISNTERKKRIRENRRIEKEVTREQERFNLPHKYYEANLADEVELDTEVSDEYFSILKRVQENTRGD